MNDVFTRRFIGVVALLILIVCVYNCTSEASDTFPPLDRFLADIRDKPIGPNQAWFGEYDQQTDTVYSSKVSINLCAVEAVPERACTAIVNRPVDSENRFTWRTDKGEVIYIQRCMAPQPRWLYVLCPVSQ